MNIDQGKMIVTALPSLYPLQRYEEEAIKAVIGAISSNHENDVPDANAGELIRRQAAVEVVQNRHMMLSKEKVLLINDLEKLPPVEPQLVECDPLLAADKVAQGRLLSAYYYLDVLKDFSEMGYVLAKRREI